MNAPHRVRTLHDIRRPWLHWIDPRVALGAVIPRRDWPNSLCVHCFSLTGALIQATVYDANGLACCPACAGNANRRGQ